MALTRFTRQLGRGGPEVSALGLGTMGLSAYYSPPEADEERFALLNHAYKAGNLFWDSADSYGDSEELLGRWFKLNPGKRENVFLATKFGISTDPTTGTRTIRNDPEYIQQACEKSLEKLGVEYIDLYYCHRIQSSQPIETTVQAMKKLQEAGKAKHIGLSECSAETLRRACKVVHIDAVQVEYSPFSLEIEDPQIGLLTACRELGVAIVAYSPLGRGFLTGAIRSVNDFKPDDSRLKLPRFSGANFEKNLALVEQFKTLAEEKGCSPGQLALAFLMAQGEDIIPIPGTTKIKRFEENMASLKVNISAEDNCRLRKAINAMEVHGSRYPESLAQSLFADTVLRPE